jgi:hypothetical protein
MEREAEERGSRGGQRKTESRRGTGCTEGTFPSFLFPFEATARGRASHVAEGAPAKRFHFLFGHFFRQYYWDLLFFTFVPSLCPSFLSLCPYIPPVSELSLTLNFTQLLSAVVRPHRRRIPRAPKSSPQYFDPPMPATIYSRTVCQARAFVLGLVRPLAYAFDISHAASYHREQNETRTTTVTPDRETCERDGEGGEDYEDHERGEGKGRLHAEREVRCILLRFLGFFELVAKGSVACGGWGYYFREACHSASPSLSAALLAVRDRREVGKEPRLR